MHILPGFMKAQLSRGNLYNFQEAAWALDLSPTPFPPLLAAKFGKLDLQMREKEEFQEIYNISSPHPHSGKKKATMKRGSN